MIITSGNDAAQKTVVIVGVQRGGTSMVAGAVRELGVNLGKNLGNNHEDPLFLPKDIEAIRTVVAKRNAEFDVWGWKMPHTSEYLAKLAPELRNPFVIVVFRNLLAMAESQMKRSETIFETAFRFSLNRLIQVSSLVPELQCPMMLVNYEKAVAKPRQFVDELNEFLHLNADPSAQERAIEMINPEVGYRRLSAERWRHSVAKAEAFDRELVEYAATRKDHNILRVEGRIQKTAENGFVEFSGLEAKRVFLTMTRDGNPDFVRVIVDVGKGFSGSMAEKVSLYRGGNVITVEAERICGIRVRPEFDGIWSNTRLFRIHSEQAATAAT